MCGVYGFAGKPTKETAKIFRYLGFLNQARGKDSTGFCYCSKDRVLIEKDSEKSTKFYSKFENMKKLQEFTDKPFCILMGHTRQATVGAINKENAHPFRMGHIIMTHNGHINNYLKLGQKMKRKCDVDSQIIGHLLEKDDSIKSFSKLDGWFTVPYINLKRKDLLSVAVSPSGWFSYAIKGDQVYYSSVIGHLRTALSGEKGFTFVDGEGNKMYRFYLVKNYMLASTQHLNTSTGTDFKRVAASAAAKAASACMTGRMGIPHNLYQ